MERLLITPSDSERVGFPTLVALVCWRLSDDNRSLEIIAQIHPL